MVQIPSPSPSMFGKGAILLPEETRHEQAHIFGAAPTIDWSVPYSVEEAYGFKLDTRSQDGSSSCTAQATCYYTEALNKVENGKDEKHSARYLYSQTYLPGGGAYIFAPMKKAESGTASAASVPDGDSREEIMRDRSVNYKAVLEARPKEFAVVPRSNIDQLATIIRDYHGFVSGFNGTDTMFGQLGWTNIPSKVDWGHAIYCCKYEIRNGVKCIGYKNSWDNWGDNSYGWFPEEFVNSGYMFDLNVYASIEDIDPNYGMNLIMLDGGKDVYLVTDGKKNKISNLLAFQILGGNIDQVQKLTQAQLDLIPDSGNELLGWKQE